MNFLTNAKGENIGHVEVMQDVTKTIRQQKYQAGEFKRLSSNLKNLSVGSLDLDLNVTEADDYTKEMSKEYQNVNKDLMQVMEAISSMANDADSLVDAAIIGKLGTRADASKHQGVYGNIVQGVNDTLDAVIAPLNVAAKYVDDISKGAIPAKITDTYNGDFNVIKNNLNQCIDAVKNLVVDAGMLSKAESKSKLATRADASSTRATTEDRPGRQRHAGRDHRTSERGGEDDRRHLEGRDRSRPRAQRPTMAISTSSRTI